MAQETLALATEKQIDYIKSLISRHYMTHQTQVDRIDQFLSGLSEQGRQDYRSKVWERNREQVLAGLWQAVVIRDGLNKVQASNWIELLSNELLLIKKFLTSEKHRKAFGVAEYVEAHSQAIEAAI